MPYTEASKEYNYKYKLAYPEKWAEQQRKNQRAWYARNKDAKCAYMKERYYRLKALKGLPPTVSI